MLGSVPQIAINENRMNVVLGEEIVNRLVLLATIVRHKDGIIVATPSTVDVIPTPALRSLRLPYGPRL